LSKKLQISPNKLCAKCLRHCKQDDAVLLLDCPRFCARPFKSPVYTFAQLDLFGGSDPVE
jgi:hypothetical protein